MTGSILALGSHDASIEKKPTSMLVDLHREAVA